MGIDLVWELEHLTARWLLNEQKKELILEISPDNCTTWNNQIIDLNSYLLTSSNCISCHVELSRLIDKFNLFLVFISEITFDILKYHLWVRLDYQKLQPALPRFPSLACLLSLKGCMIRLKKVLKSQSKLYGYCCIELYVS